MISGESAVRAHAHRDGRRGPWPCTNTRAARASRYGVSQARVESGMLAGERREEVLDYFRF